MSSYTRTKIKEVGLDDRLVTPPEKPLSERPGFKEQLLRGQNIRELAKALMGLKTYYLSTIEGGFSMDTPVSSQSSISNSTTEGTFYTRAIAANALVAGQQFRVRLFGRYSTGNGTDTNTFRFKMGGTTRITVVTIAGSVTNKPWSAELFFTVRSIGASGQVQFNVRAESNGVVVSTSAGGVATVDTTAACDITFTSQWSAATAGSVVYLEAGCTEVVTEAAAASTEAATFENGVLISST